MIEETLFDTEEKMETSVELLQKDLATIRTGHATPALVEHIKVDYAGVPTPLNHIAGISAPEARLLVIRPWDKTNIRNIEKAILTSDLGLNPSSDGEIIRLNIPELTEERRRELIKIVHHRVEERRIAIRNIRREGLDQLKGLLKDKDISQDEHKRAMDQLQKITDVFIARAEEIGKEKETELMEL